MPSNDVNNDAVFSFAATKVDIHLMPNLPGSTIEGDVEMFDKVLGDPDLQADQWKVTACVVCRFYKS